MIGVKVPEEAYSYSKSCNNLVLVIIGCTLSGAGWGVIPASKQHFLRSEMVCVIFLTFGWGGDTVIGWFGLCSWFLFPKLETSGKWQVSVGGFLTGVEASVYPPWLEGSLCECTAVTATEASVSMSLSSVKANRESLVGEARSELLAETTGPRGSASASSAWHKL